MSTGTVHAPSGPIGSNLPAFDNYYCRDCNRIVHVRKGSPGFRACPTPGCRRPTGFGVFVKVRGPVPGPGRVPRSAHPSVATYRNLGQNRGESS
jgi:hypothetical protein